MKVQLLSLYLRGLNPCCRGRWSRTVSAVHIEEKAGVLILVVVEDGLARIPLLSCPPVCGCLNPCCCGRWSSTFKQLRL